jgi:hypothetical protein
VVNKSIHQSEFHLQSHPQIVTIWQKEAKVLQIEQNPTYRKYKDSTYVFGSSSSQSTHLPRLDLFLSGLPSLRRNSENYNSTQFRSHGNAAFLCWCYIGASFGHWFYFLLDPICYWEMFTSLNLISKLVGCTRLPVFVLSVLSKDDSLCCIINFVIFSFWISLFFWRIFWLGSDFIDFVLYIMHSLMVSFEWPFRFLS